MEITERTEIKENTPEGWSRHPVWQYQKKDQGKAIVRRGYDTWTFADFDKGILVSTVSADIGIAGIHSISYMDYERKQAVSVNSLTRKISQLPRSSEEDSNITYFDSSLMVAMMKRGERRRLLITAPYLALPSGEEGFKADITLTHRAEDESLSSLASNGKGFMYKTRYVPLKTEGTIFRGDSIETISARSLGAVTWSRSRGTVSSKFSELTAFGSAGGRNFGIAVSGTSSLQNAILIDGRVIKISGCNFFFPHDYMSSSWHIEDSDEIISIDLNPVAFISQREKILSSKGEGIEIYGTITGTFKIDGTELRIEKSYGSVKMAALRS